MDEKQVVQRYGYVGEQISLVLSSMSMDIIDVIASYLLDHWPRISECFNAHLPSHSRVFKVYQYPVHVTILKIRQMPTIQFYVKWNKIDIENLHHLPELGYIEPRCWIEYNELLPFESINPTYFRLKTH